MNNTMKYIGKKEVQAERMNEYEAVQLGYARPNEDNHEWREGYHVIYPDGSPSWAPFNVFNAAYKLAETHIDRMIIESYELKEKIGKLEKFINAQISMPSALKNENKLLLQAQLNAMASYSSILQIRLQREKVHLAEIALIEPCRAE